MNVTVHHSGPAPKVEAAATFDRGEGHMVRGRLPSGEHKESWETMSSVSPCVSKLKSCWLTHSDTHSSDTVYVLAGVVIYPDVKMSAALQ